MPSALATLVQSFGPFGLLLPALVCAGIISRSLGRRLFVGSPRRQQALGGLVLALSLFVGGMQLLLYMGAVRRGVMLGGLLAATVAAYVAGRTAGASAKLSASERSWNAGTLPALSVCGFALALACLAAYWLPIWQWDALGYHLPFVNFVLQGGGFADLPRDVPYLSTYPRNVELLFVGLRAMLPDDRLLDLGQVPLGLVGAAATAGIARELGAGRPEALAAGAAWLVVPAVFLQLPTNYIDVGSASFFLLAAFFILTPATRATLFCAGLATGLFLGTKPNAPPAAALLLVMLLARGIRAKLAGAAALGAIACGALGLEAYVTEFVRHGNPVWPAIVDLGPVHLGGTISLRELLSSGAGAEKVVGPLPVRVWKSWSSFGSRPVFDMRVGGLGATFWLALPGAASLLVLDRRRLPFGALLLIVLATPDPAVARYVLAFPALVLAGAAGALAFVTARGRTLAHAAVALAGAYNVSYAAPGLTGEGPPLLSYAAMSWEDREVAVGANGPPTDFVRVRNRLTPGETAVYDRSAWLPYLMWRSDSSNRVTRISDDATVDTIKSLLERPDVRLIAAGTNEAASAAIAKEPERFVPSFDCPEACRVYVRR